MEGHTSLRTLRSVKHSFTHRFHCSRLFPLWGECLLEQPQDCWLFHCLACCSCCVKQQRRRETTGYKVQPPGLAALRVECLRPPLSLIKERRRLLKLLPLSLAKEALSSGGSYEAGKQGERLYRWNIRGRDGSRSAAGPLSEPTHRCQEGVVIGLLLFFPLA